MVDAADGPIKRKAGDLYLVDVAVTGSNEGTTVNPKCSIQQILHHHIIPAVRKLIGPGGRYEGYLPVPQSDSAGPHIEAVFLRYVMEACQREGWMWEPQAPQMPHSNVLDLSVFPAISRRHCALVRQRGGLHVLKEDDIWKSAQ